jgi:hypothetical protein
MIVRSEVMYRCSQLSVLEQRSMKMATMSGCVPWSLSGVRLMKTTAVCQCSRHFCGGKLMKTGAGASTWVDVGVVPDVWPGRGRDPSSEHTRIGSEASAVRRSPSIEQRRVVYGHVHACMY